MRLKLAACLATVLAMVLAAPAGPAAAQPDGTSNSASQDRPYLVVDQVRCTEFPPELRPQIEPLKTLEEVEQLLRSNGIAFERRVGVIDTRTVAPQLIAVIAALPPGEVFVIPQKGLVVFNRVLRALTPDEASALRKGPRSEVL